MQRAATCIKQQPWGQTTRTTMVLLMPELPMQLLIWHTVSEQSENHSSSNKRKRQQKHIPSTISKLFFFSTPLPLQSTNSHHITSRDISIGFDSHVLMPCLLMNLADMLAGRVGDSKEEGRKEMAYRTLCLKVHRNTDIGWDLKWTAK